MLTSHLALQRKSLLTSAIDDSFRTLSDTVKQIAILDAFHMTMSAVNKVTATCIVNRPRKSRLMCRNKLEQWQVQTKCENQMTK
jgi:hypothetical protein